MNTIPDPPVPTEADIARNRAQLMDMIATRPSARGRRRLITGTVAAAVVIGAGTAGAIVLTATPHEIAKGVVCYSAPSANALAIRAMGADQAPDITAQKALDVCGALWGNGTITQGATHAPGDGVSQWPDRPAPALGACIGRDGVTAVFPLAGNTTPQQLCAALDLKEAPSGR